MNFSPHLVALQACFQTLIVFSSISLASVASAQMVPDSSLPNPTQVNVAGPLYQITGGTSAGGNLFHSFREFSVPTGTTAYFNNPATIQNIFSRVTGNSISHIDGLIRANGAANLFLLNPQGILFGPNAQLKIGGSFIATTATSILFRDRTSFSATEVSPNSLLTISVPIGLQLHNPGAIRVLGNGHALTRPNPLFGEIKRGPNSTGLQVQPGQTLALIGGDISLEGGSLSAPGGHLALGSVGKGIVNIYPTLSPASSAGMAFGYEQASSFGKIQLSQLALADVSGNGGGSIHLQGQHISLRDGSAVLSQNWGDRPSGPIKIDASDTLEIIGSAPDGRIRTAVVNETVGVGAGGPSIVQAKQVKILNGGSLYTATYNRGNAGDITIEASEAIEVKSFSPVNPLLASLIATPTYATGQAGTINITTQRLSLMAGGAIFASTFGVARGGDVTVQATDLVEVIGVNPVTFQPSNLVTITFNQGNAGNLRINTSRLVVRDGSSVNGGTVAAGKSGSVSIEASKSVEVSGASPGVSQTSISSAALPGGASLQQLARLPDRPSGDSGDLTITTPLLIVRDRGTVNVSNVGTGKAGLLRVNAQSIQVSDRGRITAATASGEGGDISLQTQNLQLWSGGQITATAGGSGNGGNLTLNAGAIATLEESKIEANAVRGRGGNIQINTQGLFESANAQITATSQFGLSGNVQLSTPNINPSSGLVDLPQTPVDVSRLIARDPCTILTQNSFRVTGRGGLPASPNEPQTTYETAVRWIGPIEGEEIVEKEGIETHQNPAPIPPVSHPDDRQFVEATGWIVSADGKVRLTTQELNSQYTSRLMSSSCR